MVAEAMTEVESGEDTRDESLVGQVVLKRLQVRKAHSLIGQVYDPRNLARAWERVRENRGAGGVDRISIDRFTQDHRRYLTVLHQRLGNGSYRPQPVRRVEIDKPGTSAKRPLGIPVIGDRILQALTLTALEPEWEARFEPKAYGFRPGRGCHDAIEAIFNTVSGRNPQRR